MSKEKKKDFVKDAAVENEITEEIKVRDKEVKVKDKGVRKSGQTTVVETIKEQKLELEAIDLESAKGYTITDYTANKNSVTLHLGASKKIVFSADGKVRVL